MAYGCYAWNRIGNEPKSLKTATATTNYYVSQTTTGCESTRPMILVIIKNGIPY